MREETDVLLSLQRVVAAALPNFVEILTEVENEDTERPFAVVAADRDFAPLDTSTNHPQVVQPYTIYAYVSGASRTLARKAAEDARTALWHALAVGDTPNRERLLELWDYTGKPAVQHIELDGATGGTWTLALDSIVSTPIPQSAQPRDVREAVEGLRVDLPGNVIVYGRIGGPFDIRFDYALRGQPVDTMTVDTSDLVGPAPAGAVTVISVGSPDPWRGDRDYMRVDQPSFGGVADPTDPRLRTAIVNLRLVWGRFGFIRSGEVKIRTVRARYGGPPTQR